MSASLSVSSIANKIYHNVVVTGSGLTASTAYTLTIQEPNSATNVLSFPITTNGSGGFSFTFVPNVGGTHLVGCNLVTTASQATTSFSAGTS